MARSPPNRLMLLLRDKWTEIERAKGKFWSSKKPATWHFHSTFCWLELSHVTTPNHKGSWEIQSSSHMSCPCYQWEGRIDSGAINGFYHTHLLVKNESLKITNLFLKTKCYINVRSQTKLKSEIWKLNLSFINKSHWKQIIKQLSITDC